MGAVFEAEDLETGRRLALKVLSHGLDSPEARDRFFREGRLAASINHPNSVYVFGTEEIAGTPVIAMELLPGGTLQDRVSARGPLPVAEAVDATLQIVAGLEAAQRVGILHRDVKPSNCFVDPDGTVKIGDFGLSISTALRTEPALTASGAFLGTPAFCAPEQLRGEELNARSDIYSVGATLFYLLTGRTPFEAKNVVALIASALEQPAPAPSRFRKDVPRDLGRVVVRCLQKDASERFKSYADLRQALAAFSSTAPAPASLPWRFLAGLLDLQILNLLFLGPILLTVGDPMEVFRQMLERTHTALAMAITATLVSVLYYAVCEALWGATPGKLICRLRVARLNRGEPGFGRTLARAAIYVLVPMLPVSIVVASDPRALVQSWWGQVWGLLYYALLAALFCTARGRNGFAALHDLASATRVTSRPKALSRPALGEVEGSPAKVQAAAVVGPYHVIEALQPSGETEWVLGFDLRLLRKVWIRKVAPSTPPVPAPLRNLSRPGRLRWLTGRRSDAENWDAFEAPSGKPLLTLAQVRQPWARVRFWLFDLAAELHHARHDDSVPQPLKLDRVWITNDCRAKLLDFPAPGLPRTEEKAQAAPPLLASPAEFLDRAVSTALAGSPQSLPVAAAQVPVPLPGHARRFLAALPRLPDAGAVTAALGPLLTRVPFVSRWRRAALVAGCLVFPLIIGATVPLGARLLGHWASDNPGLIELSAVLQSRWVQSHFDPKHNRPSDETFAVYIASHYREVITNEATWNGPLALAMIKGGDRLFAERCVKQHPAPGGNEVQAADAAMKPFVPKDTDMQMMFQPLFPLIIAEVALIFYVCVPALLAALLFRGGLVQRIAGVTFVRGDGARASRLRVFWRAAVAWSPVIVAQVLYLAAGPRNTVLAQALAVAFVALFAGWSVTLPGRGLQDRLAGIWPVPR